LRLVIAASFTGLIATASCGAGVEVAPASEVIVIAPPALSLTTGASASLSASVIRPDGTQDTGVTFAWSSLQPSIVSVSADGTVTALSRGSALIVAARGTSSATAVVTVSAPSGVGLSISSAREVLWVNDSITAVAHALIGGTPAIPLPSIRWSSSRPEIVDVSQFGVLRGIAPGVSIIAAQTGASSATLRITVVAMGVLHIDGAHEIVPGWETQLSARGPNGESYTGPAQWTASDSTIASVSSTGVLTARRVGTTISHAVAAGQSLAFQVTVRTLAGRIGVARGGALALMSLDETQSVFIPQRDGGSLVRPHMALSPDGHQVAYDCGISICREPVDASQRFEVVFNKGTFPSWTGDGKTIVAQTDYAEVGVVDIATGRLARIRTFLYVDRPRVSPDGRNIAYDCDYSNPYDSLDDICLSPVAAVASGSVLVGYGTRVAWANDGARIAYLAVDGVCVAPATPQPPCTLVLPANEDNALTEITWSSDSKHLLITRGRELWILDPDGSNRTRQVSTRYGFTSPSWSASP